MLLGRGRHIKIERDTAYEEYDKAHDRRDRHHAHLAEKADLVIRRFVISLLVAHPTNPPMINPAINLAMTAVIARETE